MSTRSQRDELAEIIRGKAERYSGVRAEAAADAVIAAGWLPPVEAAERVRLASEGQGREVVHLGPPVGSGVMPCCGRTPLEVPRTDRMTYESEFVTCSVQVERLAALLGELYTAAGALMYVSSPHRFLSGRTVAEAIHVNDFAAIASVSDQLDALADGVPL
ncbi:hypothetical protein ASD11_01330 [Aeromicrobium sp. Root495]|uniref:hypothetical protein n=1 Tax=Aeromicrobium sp. Root495 TaxID=1736550 RepID=UPI0006FB22BA|nr:hypothetical protein [Aeromicrobium sp. Root495]KQY58337.1 hypothetical protein ASD11_01330 [Aeromicrobium sp. Root495]